MTAGLSSLHKILKDETRRKAILLLNEKRTLSYTDLMDQLEIISTGTLNYHLKVLGDLLSKSESGQYALTERGKLAYRLLIEFPEEDNALQTKKIWWKRFWIAATLLQLASLSVVVTLYFAGFTDITWVVRGAFAFIFGMAFLYFFYRMIRPPRNGQKEQTRTIQDITLSGKTIQEVKEEVSRWIADQRIEVEAEREDFIRGRLGIPSGLGLTAPKYFEVVVKPAENGVLVHTEGWISLYDVSERSFSNRIFISGNIPRRKGWKVMSNLWQRLRNF